MYRVILTLEELKNFFIGKKIVAFDFECSPNDGYRVEEYAALDPHKADITGISFSAEKGVAVYVPLAHRYGRNIDNVAEVMAWLKVKFFENREIIKVAHNISYESSFLFKYGIVVQAPVYDTICASQLTLKSKYDFRKLYDCGLKKLVPEIFGVNMPSFLNVTKDRHFDELHSESNETIEYACGDADFTLRLYHRINKWFSLYMPKHKVICEEVESPTAVYTGIMKYNGIKVDKELMFLKQKEAEERLNEIKRIINKFAGKELKIGANASTKDLKEFLFNDLALPILKVTEKLKESMDDEAFVLLKEWCSKEKQQVIPFIELLQEYRKWSKLKSTYIDGLMKYINTATGKIHADFMPMGTDTGRFSSSKPNLQNIPRNDNDPVGVRDFFVPSPGHVLMSFDFSQVELRVAAHYCKDETMVNTYNNDGDIHGMTTALIYGVPFEEAVDKNSPYYKERRTIAKNCNFGIAFGLYPKGLQSTLKFKAGIEKSEKECAMIINNIKRGYPKLEKWQNETKSKALIIKYTETALGRRRMLAGINSTDWNISSYWQRCALNTPIQGTAADILKLAIGRILKELPRRPYIKPLLQIHDELVFEVREDKIKESAELIKSIMEEKPFEEFNVQIKTEGEMGYRFGKMESITYGEVMFLERRKPS